MSVIIIGGGITGTTLALALSHLTHGQMDIDLVEAQTLESRIHPAFDARAISLTQRTCHELKTIGVWPVLASYATAVNQVEVSDCGHVNKVLITASEYQLPALSYVIRLYDAGVQLFNLLRKAPGVRLHCPAVLKHIKREQSGNLITLDNGCQLSSRLIVAADGSHSPLAAQCGIRWQQRDYQQVAVITDANTTLPHNGNAFERFTSNGLLALLPMSDGCSSLVWCLPAKHQQEILLLKKKQFYQVLQQIFGWRLGRITGTGERYCYSLKLLTAERHISHRLALVGNAAQTLHPIAGQGLNLGLRDVITLAEILAQAVIHGEDIGDYAILRRYQQRRQPDQAGMVNITDGLICLFANHYLPLVVGRNIGLLAISHIPLLRDILAWPTLGWVTR